MKDLAIRQANQELEELYSDSAMEQNMLKEEALYEEYKIQLVKDNADE